MIDDLETELTGAIKETLDTENLAVTEEADFDEAIPIYLKKELNTQAYKAKWTLILIRLTHMNK